jgi:Uma2 family endonuclease
MNRVLTKPKIVLGRASAGRLLKPAEFDAVTAFDENYRYELINGVVVVLAIPLPAETGPNELLGYYLLQYQMTNPSAAAALDATLPQQYVRTRSSRRLADRLIWTGLGRVPDTMKDVATIAVEFVSAGRRSWRRDYLEKRKEYRQAGIKEYWIFDRFERTLTVHQYRADKTLKKVIRETHTYQSPLLPGFDVPVAQILEAADKWARKKA